MYTIEWFLDSGFKPSGDWLPKHIIEIMNDKNAIWFFSTNEDGREVIKYVSPESGKLIIARK